METDCDSDENRRTYNILNNDHLYHMHFCVCWADQLRL